VRGRVAASPTVATFVSYIIYIRYVARSGPTHNNNNNTRTHTERVCVCVYMYMHV